MVLGAMANTKRLIVLCNLLEGEKSVGQLAGIVGLSPAALSQHLGKMRAFRLVETRRDGQIIYYRLASRVPRFKVMSAIVKSSRTDRKARSAR